MGGEAGIDQFAAVDRGFRPVEGSSEALCLLYPARAYIRKDIRMRTDICFFILIKRPPGAQGSSYIYMYDGKATKEQSFYYHFSLL